MNQATPAQRVKKLLSELGLKPIHALGQNFLIDDLVLDQIIETLNPGPEDFLIEVGPGTGRLTQRLVDTECDLLCIEKDRGLSEHLLRRYERKNLTILHGDVLEKKRNFHPELLRHLREASAAGKSPVFVSNLPYAILTPFFWNLLHESDLWESGIFLVQKEFAERLVAEPGNKNYAPLSVVVALDYQVRLVRHVSRELFWPKPKVDSSLILFEKRHIRIANHERMAFVQFLFQHRRKMLRTILKPHISDDQLHAYFDREDVSPTIRAEQLSPEQMIRLHQVTNKPKEEACP